MKTYVVTLWNRKKVEISGKNLRDACLRAGISAMDIREVKEKIKTKNPDDLISKGL